MKNFIKILFFISSYFPLFVFLVINNITPNDNKKHSYKGYKEIWANMDLNTKIFWMTIFILIIVSILAMYFITHWMTTRHPMDVPNVNLLKDEVMSYVVTYVVPLLSLDIKNTASLIINLLLFITIGIIYVKNDLIYLNPVLSLFGYRVYSNEHRIFLSKMSSQEITRLRELNEKVIVWHIIGEVYMMKRSD